MTPGGNEGYELVRIGGCVSISSSTLPARTPDPQFYFRTWRQILESPAV